MNDKKKYNEALERARKLYEQGTITESLCYVFPELKESKESEDERIRKGIIKYLEQSQFGEEHYCVDDDVVRDYIAWLEKQGEPIEINPSEFESQLNRLLKRFESLPKEDLASSLSFYLNVVQNDGTYKEEEQGEQNPVWSEEDERLKTSCIKHIEEELERIRNDKYGHSEIISDLKESCRERINWLESLKERCTWKPSEEQMHYLSWVANVKLGDSIVEQEVSKHLNELLEDLKKL